LLIQYIVFALITTVRSTTCFDDGGTPFPKLLGSFGGPATRIESVDVAADGRVVVAVGTEDTSLGGPNASTSKVVMLYNPVTGVYEWS
jgi:hypothetical protein